jgi:hypothetical protein
VKKFQLHHPLLVALLSFIYSPVEQTNTWGRRRKEREKKKSKKKGNPRYRVCLHVSITFNPTSIL